VPKVTPAAQVPPAQAAAQQPPPATPQTTASPQQQQGPTEGNGTTPAGAIQAPSPQAPQPSACSFFASSASMHFLGTQESIDLFIIFQIND
jgi:hypothetical protein